MKWKDFEQAYRAHDGEEQYRIFTDCYGSYKIEFQNGDSYRYEMKLQPESKAKSVGERYGKDDFTYACCWNGDLIEPYKK